ncbi:UDP-glycosyltransferase 13 [Sesamum indicum]|uniref:Glycosyltransferase n=1 Tax=Sesamum indicum TaxID=4182 RepID=A0A6I9UUS0_SESIN|nr:UDP-glycosyltransferase 13 [Sesamum indicum]
MATTTKSEKGTPPHLALFPCAGMGHLMPFLRLAAMLASRGCSVTFITVQPTVSAAESDHLSSFFSTHPHIKRLEFPLPPYKKSKFLNNDPFFIQAEAIGNAVHLLRPVLSCLSPSLSAIVADFSVASSVSQLASDLSISTYILITTSARFLSLMVYFPLLAQYKNTKNNAGGGNGYIELPGIGPMPVSSIPPAMLDDNNFFAVSISTNVSSIFKVKSILINTFNWIESEAIEALNSSGVAPHPAPILPVGPLESFDIEQASDLPWLDEQAPESVVFVSFGSRTALSKDQIKELTTGLEKSGCTFLWVLKASKVDKDDTEKVEDIVGESFLGRAKKKGIVIKGWVNQEQILAHPAIGGFVSHCGWNSVIEAARLGVPILAWPQHGDQRINAEVVEKVGFGLWVREWGWTGEKLVDGNDIADRITELMLSENLRARAKEVKEKARHARETNGSSERLLQGLIDSFKSKEET